MKSLYVLSSTNNEQKNAILIGFRVSKKRVSNKLKILKPISVFKIVVGNLFPTVFFYKKPSNII